jgi:hypothetical protein
MQLRDYQNRPREWLRLGAGLLALSLLAVGTVFVILGLIRLARRRAPGGTFVGGLASLSLCLVLYLLAGQLPAPEDGSPIAAARPLPAVPQVAQQTRPVDRTKAPMTKPPVDELGKVAGNLGQMPPGVFRMDMAKAPLPTGVFADADNNSRPLPAASVATPGPRPESATTALLLRQTGAESRLGGFGSGGFTPPPYEMYKEGAANKSTTNELSTRFNNAVQAQFHNATGGEDVKSPAAKKGKAGAGKEAIFDTVREYVHLRKDGDYHDTILWHPALPLRNGRAEVGFDLPANPANYRILINAHTPDGRLGSYQGTLEVRPKAAK